MFDSDIAEKNYEAGFPKYYKHKTIMRFSVGVYQFANHLLQVDDADQNEDFMREVRGLLAVDQINIVEVLNIENERPVDSSSRVLRGSTTSHNTGLSEQSSDTRIAELNRREQELIQRETVLANREAGGGRITYEQQGTIQQDDPILPIEGEADPVIPAEGESAPVTDREDDHEAAPAGIKLGGVKLGGK